MVQYLGSFVQTHCYECFKSLEKLKKNSHWCPANFTLYQAMEVQTGIRGAAVPFL